MKIKFKLSVMVIYIVNKTNAAKNLRYTLNYKDIIITLTFKSFPLELFAGF